MSPYPPYEKLVPRRYFIFYALVGPSTQILPFSGTLRNLPGWIVGLSFFHVLLAIRVPFPSSPAVDPFFYTSEEERGDDGPTVDCNFLN